LIKKSGFVPNVASTSYAKICDIGGKVNKRTKGIRNHPTIGGVKQSIADTPL